jgi:hypothetical protein
MFCLKERCLLNSVHVTAAAAIVRIIPDPGFAWPLALASHIALDTIPHWNWHPGGTKWRIAASVVDIGVALGLSIGLAFWSQHYWVTLGACLLSMVPDLIQAPYHLWKWKPRWLQSFVSWESKRQKWAWMKPWMGLATQVVTALLMVAVLLSIR